MNRLWALVCLFLFAMHPAFAETRSVSYATWNVTGANVRVLYMLPTSAAKTLAAPGAPVLTTKQVSDYLLAHLAVIHPGKACMVVDQGEDLGLINTLSLIPGYLRFEVLFECPDGNGLTLSDTAFADRVANHVAFARVQINNGGLVQHIFTSANPRFALPAAGARLQSDSAFAYAGLGFSHVYRSTEILCFVVALLLLVRRRRDFAMGLGALAAGYGVAALLSVFNLAAPRFEADQAMAGLFILMAAAGAVVLRLSDPKRGAGAIGVSALVLAFAALFLHGTAAALAILGAGIVMVSVLWLPNRDDARVAFLLIAPFLFAALDGFTLTKDLLILNLAPSQLAPMILGFNVATFLAELALPLVVVAAWFLVPVMRRLTMPGRLIPEVAASLFIASGMFWFATWLL
jgi:hypothetical protein